MGIGLNRPEVINRDDLEVLPPGFDDRAQYETPDASKPIDRDADGHSSFLSFIETPDSDSALTAESTNRFRVCAGPLILSDTPGPVAQTSFSGAQMSVLVGWGFWPDQVAQMRPFRTTGHCGHARSHLS
jgi:hypothetical protein